jgi:hypothetical protein
VYAYVCINTIEESFVAEPGAVVPGRHVRAQVCVCTLMCVYKYD